jgi:ABC-type multidrug transport system fused ATPase/permease subunit
MSTNESRSEIISRQYEFWMGIKHALGMAPKWKGAPSPHDKCVEGYSTNKILHNSRECFQERLDNIQSGWKTSDALLFASMLFSIPLTVFFIWGWCANNVLQVSSAASRAYWLQKLFEQSQADPKRQDKIQGISDNCGSIYLSTSEDLDLPFWYSAINPPPECANRESVKLTHFVENDPSNESLKFVSTTRDAWIECLNTRIGGEAKCPADNTKSNKERQKKVKELVKYDWCPPNTTYYLYPGMRKLWWRGIEIAEFAQKNNSPPKPSLYVANAGGSQIPGDAVSSIGYFSFWHRQYIIAPLIAWKMWMLSGIYNFYGGFGADITTYKNDYHKHGEPEFRQSSISVEQCNQDKEKSSNIEILAWILTPLFPLLIFGIHTVEVFYMFFLVVVAFFTQACGRIWPLHWPVWERAFRALGGFFDREAALASEKATNTWMSTFAVLTNFIKAVINLIYLLVVTIIVTILYLSLGVVAGFIFGPLFTMIMGLFTYILGPLIAGDGWASGFAGHFMNIIGYEESDYPKWLYIRKFKFAILIMSIILTVFSKPVTMYLDPMLIGIIILVLILSIVFPRIGSFIGLSSALKSATDSKSKPDDKPDDKAGVAVDATNAK